MAPQTAVRGRIVPCPDDGGNHRFLPGAGRQGSRHCRSSLGAPGRGRHVARSPRQPCAALERAGQQRHPARRGRRTASSIEVRLSWPSQRLRVEVVDPGTERPRIGRAGHAPRAAGASCWWTSLADRWGRRERTRRAAASPGSSWPRAAGSTRTPQSRRAGGTGAGAILAVRAAVAQLARASACHAEGRGFESHQPLRVKAPLRRGFLLGWAHLTDRSPARAHLALPKPHTRVCTAISQPPRGGKALPNETALRVQGFGDHGQTGLGEPVVRQAGKNPARHPRPELIRTSGATFAPRGAVGARPKATAPWPGAAGSARHAARSSRRSAFRKLMYSPCRSPRVAAHQAL